MSRLIEKITLLRFRFKISEANYLLILSAIVGVAVGLTAIVFRLLLSHSYEFFFVKGSDILGFPRMITTPLLTTFGALIVGIIVYKIFNQKGSHGVPSVMKEVATKNVNIHPRMAIKSYTSILTIGFGGSAGPEGPIVEIGSVIGAMIGRLGGVSKNRFGLLVSCGSAAGIAAIFNAPIGGVFFALEIILRDFAIKSFSPVVIASVVAALLSKAYFGDVPAFAVKKALELQMSSVYEIGFYIILGILCAALSVFFIRALYMTQDFFSKIKMQTFIKPVIGGFLVGIIGVYIPGILGEGYHSMTAILHGDVAIKLFIAWMLFKVIATCLTLGSGGTGGVFAPALFIGACAGGLLGKTVFQFFPHLTNYDAPITYALAGMAGLLAGTLNAPLTAIMMIFEITGGSYQIVVPLMITVAVSSFMTKSLTKGSIYTMSLLRDGFDVEKAALPNPLTTVVVETAMSEPKVLIKSNESLPNIINIASESDETVYPVVADNGDFIGIISINELRSVLNMGEFGIVITAGDIADPHPKTLHPNESLDEALNILSANEREAIPVLDPAEPKKLLGIIKRQDIFTIFKKISEGKITD